MSTQETQTAQAQAAQAGGVAAQAAEDDAPRLDPSSESFYDDIARLFCDSGGLGTGELLGIDEEQQEHLFAFGSSLYESGQHEQACDVFARLCRLRPDDARFVKALGMARQMAKQYEGAVEAYGVAALHDIEDAEVSIHAAECLLHLGEIGRARAAVKGAELQAQSRAIGEDLKQKLQVLKEALASYDATSNGKDTGNGATQRSEEGGQS